MNRKFFICSVGQRGSDYEDDNLTRCIDNVGHFMHKNTTQKGVFEKVEANDIVFLKYRDRLISYGKVCDKAWEKTKELGDWCYAIYVDEWIFFDKKDVTIGVSNSGVTFYTLAGAGQMGTVKEVSHEYALKKMKEIDNKSSLYNLVNNEVMMEKNMETQVNILKNNYNIVLHGAPGTGKTFLAKKIAIEGLKCPNENIGFVQFHPSYDYTDFVEGLRPIEKDSQDVGFEKKDGVFVEFCKRALKKPDENFVFIIDEINRGEMSKIFGELFYSIDPGYRINISNLATKKEKTIKTQYSNMQKGPNEFDVLLNETQDFGHFFIPDNVYIIGTMNDIDRSVDSMDFAFRRRFTFIEVLADENTEMLQLLGDECDNAKNKMKSLNYKIWHQIQDDEDEQLLPIEGLSSSYHIGAAYFLKLKNCNNDYNQLWKYNLEGLLREYLRGMEDIEGKMVALKDFYDNPDKFN